MVQKTFSELLNDILADYRNQLPEIDTAVGTMAFVNASTLAAALWGVYRYIGFVLSEIIPETATSAMLTKHAAARGITRADGESDADLLTRLYQVMRHPPAGGNKYDWEAWAREATVSHDGGAWTETCPLATCFPLARGVGTVNVAIIGSRVDDPEDFDPWTNATAYTAGDMVADDSVTGADRVYIATTSGTSSGTGVANDAGVSWEDAQGTPTAALKTAVEAIIEARRPVTANDYGVYRVTKKNQDVAMSVTGVTAATKAAIADEIRSYMASMLPARTLYPEQLSAIAISHGATSASVTVPAEPVVPDNGPDAYERVWPWKVTVT